MKSITKIDAEAVWYYFKQLLKIPRASKKEEKIQQYLINFAKQQQLEHRIDKAGNIVIIKEKTTDKNDSECVILQSHMDMVCEKNSNSSHNFDTDAIEYFIENDWMHAKDTTLGADNGIGMAMQLAILANKTHPHPTIECLFTTDEETGLYGASNIASDLLTGKTLINLDSEEEGEFCIGCAGGTDTLAKIKIEYEPTPEKYFFFTVKINGLKGGHSGEDINKNRANAIKLLSDYLAILQTKTDIRIVQINGGNLRNAIPREIETLLAVPMKDKELVRIEINHFIYEVETSFALSENQINIELESTNSRERVLKKQLTDGLIEALKNCPNGVWQMSSTIPDLVETSTNLAAIHTLENEILIETSQRSSSETKKGEIAEIVGSVFKKIGADIKKGKDYPGWEPKMESPILGLCTTTYMEIFKKEPLIKTIHAGLECGVIAKTYPHVDMISIGPTIQNPHSPNEKVSISSVEKCYHLLTNLLIKL